MRFRLAIASSLAAVLVWTCAPLLAQVQSGYKAPRSKNADGSPDINGIWQVLNTANWDLLSRPQQPGPMFELGAMFFVPPGRGVVDGEQIPYRPEAAAIKKQRF